MKARGFTLIEVMVALFVIAVSVGALLSALVASADGTGHMRDKAFAQWIALNRITEMRISPQRPSIGTTNDTVEYAGSTWKLEQQVSDPGIQGVLRIDVRVGRMNTAGSSATAIERVKAAAAGEDDAASTLGSAIGFIGTSMARPNGQLPQWTAPQTGGPGGGGPGGGGPGGGGPGGGGPGGGGPGGGGPGGGGN